MIQRLLLIYKWVGNSVRSFISTLMLFMWFFVAQFLLKTSMPIPIDSEQLAQMMNIIMPIYWNWFRYFMIIWSSRFIYDAYSIWRYDWRYIAEGNKVLESEQ